MGLAIVGAVTVVFSSSQSNPRVSPRRRPHSRPKTRIAEPSLSLSLSPLSSLSLCLAEIIH